MMLINRIYRKSTTGLSLWLIILFPILLSCICFASEPAWEFVMMPPGGRIKGISVNNKNNIFVSSYNGVFRSDNLGLNWTCISDSNFYKYIYNSDGIICGSGVDYAIRYIVNENYNGFNIFKSTDNGDTWINIDTTYDIMQISVDKNILYESIYSGFFGLSFRKTTDDGQSWDTFYSTTDTLNDYTNSIFLIKDSTFIIISHYISVSKDLGKNWNSFSLPNPIVAFNFYYKSKNELFLLTNNGIYFSDNFGIAWKEKWFTTMKTYSMLFVDDSNIIVSTSNGVFYSTDIGSTWNLSDLFAEIKTENNWCLNLSKDSIGNVYIDPLSHGIFKSSNNGRNWFEINNGFSAYSPNDIMFKDNDMYIAGWGIYKSSGDWKTWNCISQKGSSMSLIGISKDGYIFSGDIGQSGILGDIYKSLDSGRTWSNGSLGEIAVQAVLIDNKDYIYIAPGYMSRDKGDTWQDIGFAAHKFGLNDEGHVFAFWEGYIYSTTDHGDTWKMIAKTTPSSGYNEFGGRIVFNNKTKTAGYLDVVTNDNGRTWQQQFETGTGQIFGTTESSHYAIDSTFNWINNGNYHGGYICKSTDNGFTWIRLDTSGLKHKEFGPIGCSPDGHIYVFGSTGGLYRSRDAFVSVKEDTKQKEAVIIKPCQPLDKIQIEISLEYPSNIQLNIYDLIGNRLESKNYGLFEAGKATILIDNENYSTGIYLYRIEAGGSIKTGILNIVK